MSVCVLFVVGMDKNCNFSAVRSPIELKLSGDLGLVSQISVHVLVSRFDYFLYCKQTKEPKKGENRKNRGFTKLAFSQSCRVWLIWNLVGTSGKVLWIVWFVCFVYIIVCSHFVNVNKEITLYGFLAISSSNVLKLGGCLHPLLTHNVVKPVFLIHCLFMFYGYKQMAQFGAILKNAKTSSIWVSNERSRPKE
jgi:hypothetical protein